MKWFLGVLLALLVSGCTFLNVDLVKPLSPLKEKVVEGEGRRKILLLDITGVISEKERRGHLKEKPSLVAEVKEALQKAEKDHNVVGILLRVNSPGGTVTASDIIYHEIVSFKDRRKIPVYASIIGLGTSGAYYIASAADLISAHPTAVTGSIGVLFMQFQVSELLAKVGVSERTVKSGEKKDMLSPFRPSTPDEDRIMQGVIDQLYRRFVDVVLARPGNLLERKELETLADGRIYTATQALFAKLIDRVCYLDETLAALKKAAGVDRAKVVTYYRSGSYRGTIYSGEPGATGQGTTLLSIGEDGLEMLSEQGFAYLWR